MKPSVLLALAASVLLLAPTSKAQTTGRVECARSDGYVYLYSSMTTLEVRTTVQCGETVQVTGRFDNYFAVRTPKGDTGYVPVPNIVLLRDQAGSGLPQPAAPPSRERLAYDPRPATPPAATRTTPTFGLVKDTPVRVKILKALSSASVHPGDAIEFEVLEDVSVNGVLVITRGAKASGSVVEAESKKRFGHDGKLSINITSVRLSNNDVAPVRFFYTAYGSSSSSTVSLKSGKDASIPEGMEFAARVDGDVTLKRESFADTPATSSPASPAQTPSPH